MHKIRPKKIIIYLAVILVLLFAGLVSFDVKNEIEQKTGFSSYNKNEDGSLALYLLSKEMGFDVRRFDRPARLLPESATVVVFAPDKSVFEDSLEFKYMFDWLRRGNSMVFISHSIDEDEDIYSFDEFKYESKEPFGNYGVNYIYNVGDGKIIYLNEYEFYTNSGIKKLDPGVMFIDALNVSSFNMVLFNEYYHGLGSSSISLLDVVNPVGRLIIIQLFICVLIYLFIKSRRFGKPAVVFKIIKRKENENLFALSNLYTKAKANNLAIEIYLKKVKEELAKFLGFSAKSWDDKQLITAAEANSVLKGKGLRDLLGECDNYISEENKDLKQLVNLYKRLEQFRKEIKQ